MMPGWGKVRAAAQYAGVSPRTFEGWLRSGVIRHVKLPTGTRLIKYEWIDEALEKFEVRQADDRVKRIVDEIMEKLV